ncbi:MAG: hypothetical protein RBR71_14260 [Gudongella sp.]|nr:hypothetical protein [Gudongella sp.]
MTQKTEKIDVEYLGAESRRTPGLAVDYMLAIVPGEEEDIELYAEAPTVRGEETATYEGLRAEIRRQAEDAGIDPGILAFPYDGGARPWGLEYSTGGMETYLERYETAEEAVDAIRAYRDHLTPEEARRLTATVGTVYLEEDGSWIGVFDDTVDWREIYEIHYVDREGREEVARIRQDNGTSLWRMAREQLPQDVLADIDAYDPEHEELFYRIEGF